MGYLEPLNAIARLSAMDTGILVSQHTLDNPRDDPSPRTSSRIPLDLALHPSSSGKFATDPDMHVFLVTLPRINYH